MLLLHGDTLAELNNSVVWHLFTMIIIFDEKSETCQEHNYYATSSRCDDERCSTDDQHLKFL